MRAYRIPFTPTLTTSFTKILSRPLVRVGKRRFLVHANYDALLHYNCAHHYALAVGILAERIGEGL